MDDIAKRVANLSSAKRALLELKLRKKVAPLSVEGRPVADDVVKQVAGLSLTKRTLLELKLRKKAALKSAAGEPAADNIAKRVANLSSAKRALLELKLRKKATPPSAESKPATDDITNQIASLSPAKRALLEFKLKKKAEDIPARVENLSPAITPEVEALEEEVTAEPADEAISTAPDTQTAEPEVSDWLTDILPEDVETPAWLLDDVSNEEAAIQTPAEPVESAEAEEVPPPPDWMTGLREGTEDEAVSPTDSGILDFDEEPELPSWLSGDEDTTARSDKLQPDHQTGSSPAAVASPPAPARSSKWLESVAPTTEEAVTDEEDTKTVEDTGMLSGISTLLPAEKIALPTSDTGSLHEAAQEFYKIATEVPQPATLPTPLTRRERVVSGAVRSGLYLLFIVLIAIPLLPGTQKIVNNLPVPRSEPTGDDADVLDSQRRQLISEQLGIIDLQQPGTVALVSFDYSAATQGEMQPLAEAVIGRLMGQGMRVIAVSLEPEGATIAQNSLDVLAKRDQQDQYGIEVINLGYLPGQMAAIRGLITGRESLSTIPDYRENVPLGARPEWEGIQNLAQVDIVVTFADNPTTARWWVEQLETAPQLNSGEQFLLAATSAVAEPFLRPYRDSEQLDGLISGVNGAATIEAVRNRFEPGSARWMLDSIGIATIIIVILIAAGTIVGWMPAQLATSPVNEQVETVTGSENGSST